MDLKDFTSSAKNFSRNPLGIIALFIVLVYAFATITVSSGTQLQEHLAPMVYFLILFPIVVFISFLWLVVKHHDKIYAPSDFTDENNFIKMKLFSIASLVAATAKQTNDTFSNDLTSHQINSLVELVSRTNLRGSRSYGKNVAKVLWVDDRPDNNVHEREAFEAQGIEVSIALSTDEAIEKLETNNFSAIISDMGRKEGPNEGYVLLKRIRETGNSTPFFIYAGSNTAEHKKMAIERGAQGSTNKAQELYKMVVAVVQ